MIKSDRQYYWGQSQEKIFVQEWGPLDKPVVVLVHGFPGVSDHGQLMSESPYWNSFRLIAMDRPGYGRSVAQKDLTPLKFAEQMKSLIDEMKIDQLSIISVSGGAPYSMAMGYLLQNKVKKISSIGGIAPLTVSNFRYMNSQQKKVWAIRNFVPEKIVMAGAQRLWQSGLEKMEKAFFSNMDAFSSPDRQVFQHPTLGPALYETTVNALSSGPSGVLTDMKTYSKSWGFKLQNIKSSVTLWHGTQDDIVHKRFAMDMHKKLPYAKLNFVENEGHYSLLLNRRDQIIEDVLAD